MSTKSLVLIIEDDNSISKFFTALLTSNGYTAVTARTGKTGISQIATHCPDIVLLDLGLPDIDGTEIISNVREWSNVPIIVISARDHGRDKVEALDLGADDYMTKPIDPHELLARIRAALRQRARENASNLAQLTSYRVGELDIDFERRRVIVDGNEVHLTQNEYKIVALLCKHAGKVLTHDFIITNVWGPNFGTDNQILRVNMANIRRKLEKNPAEPIYILTEVGVGYRMAEPN